MATPIEVFTNGNKRLEIFTDDGIDPRGNDNLGTMYCFHRRYNYGDKHSLSMEEAKKIEDNKDYISLPIYMYDHSGQTIQTTPFSCPWDSGKLGFIAVSKEKVRKEYNWKVITKARKELIKKYLTNEVTEYNYYIMGESYRFDLYENDVEIDSCGGFLGSNHKESGLFDNAGWNE